jgi:nuclear transport factor 2 (NTF2) superfamily protein
VPITSTISLPSIRIYINSSVQIAVQFWYEWHDTTGQWWRTYGLEDWTFADNGLMRKRQMSGNDVKITNEERWFTDGVDVNTVDISEKHW